MGWARIAPWLSTTNVDTLVTACGAACSTNSVYDFCLKPRDLKADDVKLKDVTCNYLAKEQTIYGIEKCNSISCDDVVVLGIINMPMKNELYCAQRNKGAYLNNRRIKVTRRKLKQSTMIYYSGIRLF